MGKVITPAFSSRRGASRCALTAIVVCTLFFMTAAAPTVDISAKVDRSEITIGDHIRYEINVTHPASGHVELPAVLGNLGSFEVKDYKTETVKVQDGNVTEKHVFTLSTFTVGNYALPPQRVEYYGERTGGQSSAPTDTLVLFTQPTEIKVKRTSAETVKDIADIADLADIPEPLPWGAIGLGVVALALLSFFIWRKFRKKALLKTAEPQPLPPYEEAMKRLRDLRAAQLPGQNKAREFAFTLSEIFRNYVGRRYGIEALESTTEEFLDRIKPLPLSEEQQTWMLNFCESLDPLKYATLGIAVGDAELLMQAMERFADQTKPSSLPPDSPEGSVK